jgi:hypothetical protein
VINARIESARGLKPDFMDSVIERWRGATMSHKQKPEDAPTDVEAVVREEFAPLQPARGLDPDRFKILKRPADAPADVFAGPRDTLGRPMPWPHR